jgi:hypothetical protein
MSPTHSDIDALKANWLKHPLWHLENTEGYDAHRAELLRFRQGREAEWAAKQREKEAQIDAEADALCVRGLYRKILTLEAFEKRHRDAINALSDGDARRAYRILAGYPE